ncbi:TIGR00282 family metallophosphoesterase [Mycoplasma buteonis]|uniref:TIGR00282 family metallophosphoesterase n=1 Tax=Mycoplasma buteonis TaxID=171280 RepID=UPI0006902A5A|nr:TIGR00282 family metallophosphoesterase [Mycoplasma buteonis]
MKTELLTKLTKEDNYFKILFIGDVFGKPGLLTVERVLPNLIQNYKIDFVIAQGENVSGRKGLNYEDYLFLKNSGVNCLTMGNHVWANSEIFNFIDTSDVIRPLNINDSYPGKGSKIFSVKSKGKEYKIRVTSLMGISFNQLMKPWNEETANSFFDAADKLINNDEEFDFDFIDFHGETTSEKYVLGLYLDGKVDAICGTHTHVQTNDAKKFPKGTCFITDAGMTGPENSAIGANFQEVYEKMRYDAHKSFKVSENNTQFNSVLILLDKDKNRQKNLIFPINFSNIDL